jgi:hypothetical protein
VDAGAAIAGATIAGAAIAGAAIAGAAIGDAAAAGAGLAGALVARSIGACAAATAGFDASTVDVLVAIAAAAIARGAVVLPLAAGAATTSAGATTTSVAATSTAIATATGAGIAAVAAPGCGDAAGSVGAAVSGEAMMSEAASPTVVFTMPDFADSNLGLAAVPVSALPSVVTDGATLDGTSGDEAFARGLPEAALSRGWRTSVTADASPGRCCNGRSGVAAATGRSLLAGATAALPSISAEKPSGADGSVRADLDGAF